MTVTMTDLSRCPICGKVPILTETVGRDGHGLWDAVCDCKYVARIYALKEFAIIDWNQRVEIIELRAKLATLVG